MTNRWIKTAVALFAVLLLAGACSSKKDVGSDELLNGTDNGSAGTRLGETTTTTAAANTPTSAANTTAPPATAPPTTVAQVAIEVSINGDAAAGGQFQPRVAQLRSGTIIRFVNKDTVERSVVSDSQAFDSGPIAPGASWDWTAGSPGTYNYSDGTRPYAVGSIDVQ